VERVEHLDFLGAVTLVLMGSKAAVFLEQPAALIEDQKRVLTIEAFSAWFANRITQVADPTARSGP
jgi:hypothetical protein